MFKNKTNYFVAFMWGKDFINSFFMSFYCPSQNEFLLKKKLLFIQYSTLNMISNT